METGTLVIGAALVIVLIVLVVVIVQLRPGRGPAVDEALLRRMLTETLGIGTKPPLGADGETNPAEMVGATARGHRAEAATAPTHARHLDTLPTGTVPINPGQVERDQILAAARAEAEQIRAAAYETKRTASAEARAERERLAAGTAALAEEQASLAADRGRLRSDRADLARQRADISEREQALHDRMAAADARQIALDTARGELRESQAELERARTDLATTGEQHRRHVEAELVRISGLTVDDARAELLAAQEEATRRDVARMVRAIEVEAQETAKQRARAIVAEAIQRVASDQTSQSVVTVLQLPSDDLKGRIIGREGRNIRAFETVTGVNVIIDDTPEAVLLSCFDPVRREIGRVTLQMLIDDGRIHPHRIEEAYSRAEEEVAALCQRAAEDALLEVGISDLHPELVTLIGRLKYRTSYGQNVLGHLIETAHIARIMAAELGVDPIVPARGAFLHDIGKALTHEAEGSHALVGADLARKYGESDEVVHCIEAHHDEVPPSTIAAVLTQAADSCSGGRPGARRESLESYVKRLQHIEAIAAAKKGVDKVFAMQAGRELRVMVKPDVVDDLEAHMMAREVAKQIEEELTYPGQVRVTVIRESRATEVAR